MTKEQLLATVPDSNKFGDCFKVHLHLLRENPDYTLVHGVAIGNGPIEGIRHSHCWLEHTIVLDGHEFVMVKDCSNGKDVTVPASIYYLAGQIDVDLCIRYSCKEAVQLALDTDHYGPWHELPDSIL